MPKQGVVRAGMVTLGTALWLALGAAGAQNAAELGGEAAQAAAAPSQVPEGSGSQVQESSAAQVQEGSAVQVQGGASDGPKNVLARRHDIDVKAKAALDDLLSQQESARQLFDQAAGYAVFTATKAGFFVTGASGTGVAVDKRSGRRTYMRLGSGGIGVGIGAQRYSLIILFQGQEQIDRFVLGGFNAKTTAEAAAGQAGAATASSFVEGVAIFQVTSKGLMAQADVSGTRFWPIDELN